MRFLLFTFLFVLASCGQGGSSKNGSGKPDNGNMPQNDEFVTNVKEVDLLDVAMDVPVEISGNQITFKETFADSANGIKSSCSVGVTSGETYVYTLNGSSLMIKTSSGQRMDFRRVSGEGNSIVGSWTGKVREGDQLVMRRMTFVSQDRLVMRTHCES
jgi:hypothetical protein